MNPILIRFRPVRHILTLASILLLAAAAVVAAVDIPHVRAPLQPASDRQPAPDFALQDASGKTVRLRNYRGKILLLDFWATWCTGCKQEIPWFSQFQKAYGSKGFAVVGVSFDQGGWSVVRPFLADAHVPYRMLLGGDPMGQKYGIKSLPDTYLIDRQGRIATAYTTGLVDKDDVEANIKALLAEK